MTTCKSQRPGAVWSRVCAALLCVALGVGLVACGPNPEQDEKVIREGVARELDLFVEEPEELNDYLSELGIDNLDTQEAAGHLLQRFSYTIDDVEVEENTATVDLSVTGVDVAGAVATALESATSGEASSSLEDVYLAGDDAALEELLVKLVYESLDAADAVESNCTLTLTKYDNEWRVDESSVEALQRAMFGGVAPSEIEQGLLDETGDQEVQELVDEPADVEGQEPVADSGGLEPDVSDEEVVVL